MGVPPYTAYSVSHRSEVSKHIIHVTKLYSPLHSELGGVLIQLNIIVTIIIVYS